MHQSCFSMFCKQASGFPWFQAIFSGIFEGGESVFLCGKDRHGPSPCTVKKMSASGAKNRHTYCL